MKWNRFPKSPTYPAGHRWPFQKRKEGYESDVTAMVRAMLEDEALSEDQRTAWERWRNEPVSKTSA